jgi:hypothetical protein
LKGVPHAKRKRREGERVPNSNPIHFSGISDDRGDVTNAVQDAADNIKFNEERTDKYSMIFSEQEHDEFVAAGQAQMEYCHDMCNFKTGKPEAACNPVGLELTLGSRGSNSPADKLSAV